MKNNIVKDGLGGYTASELALLDWDTIYNIWNHIETGEVDFLYHMVIHRDCPIGFFLQYWFMYNSCISTNRIKILSSTRIISTSDILKKILRINDYTDDEIKSTYKKLINDKQSSWNAIFRKNNYISNIVKFEVSNELEYLDNEIKEIFIF